MSSSAGGLSRPLSTRAEAVVDLLHLRHNVDLLRTAVEQQQGAAASLMGIVKADAYGHGVVPVAQALRSYGMSWLGVALPSEALALREQGDIGRILAWLIVPNDPTTSACVAAEVDLSVGSRWLLEEICAAAAQIGRPARIHLKVDTGLGRGGAMMREWPRLIEEAHQAQQRDLVQVMGVWSHLVAGENPDHPSIQLQRSNFSDALAQTRMIGLSTSLSHLANSGAILSGSVSGVDVHGGLARSGIAMFGLTPGVSLGEASMLGLTPIMTLRTQLALVKEVPAGQGVSYGHHWTAPTRTTLGLVPLGYADGIPRTAENASVWLRGKLRPVVGRIAMDQFVVDLGADHAEAGDEVIVFGRGVDGEPTAEDWARWSGTIGYEIVTRLGPRIPRRYVHDAVDAGEVASR